MRKLFLIIVVLSLSACGYNIFDQSVPVDENHFVVNSTIGDIVEGFQRADIVVSGVVTTSDSCGNFYKEIFLQDASSGAVLCVRAGVYDLYSVYPYGANVSIRLQGLNVEWQEGLWVVELPSNLALVRLRMMVNDKHDVVLPLLVDLDQLPKVKAGRFVEIHNLYFANGGIGTFSDTAQLIELPLDPQSPKTVTLYTSPYSNFAGNELPSSIVTIRAIVLYRQGKLQLKVSDLPSIF